MDIAFATDDRYLPWCAAAIRSCLDHGGPSPTIHLLHQGSLGGQRVADRLTGMVGDSGGAIVLHEVDDNRLASLPSIGRFGTIVWLRLVLPDLLPTISRVLYLDVDTLAVSSLEPLFESELDGAPLAGVANVVQPEQRSHVRSLGMQDYRHYLNSGVLLLDLDRLRSERATEAMLKMAEQRGGDLRFPDQDTLNLVFAGRWKSLPPRWNAQYTLWSSPDVAADVFGRDACEEAVWSPGILHFEGPHVCKPWHALNDHPWRDCWWDALQRTPWSGTPPEDSGAATRVLRLLPSTARIWLYSRLLGYRNWRLATR